MGMFDSFYDEDSKCAKCNARVTTGWQTKRLESLFEEWRKGDFLQYRILETIPERERKRKYGNAKWAPAFRKTNKYLSNEPILHTGKVPVEAHCGNCDTWLQAYAKITNGRFVGIVEVEADGEAKELIVFKPGTTAKALREEFQRRLSHLQESCEHEKTRWVDMEWTLGLIYGRRLVCLRCEKVLKSKNVWPGRQRPKRAQRNDETVANPLKALIGKKPRFRSPVLVEELEELSENR